MDAHRGARPQPAFSHKVDMKLAEHIDDHHLSAEGAEQLTAFVREALQFAEDKGCEDLVAFATSAVREARNGEAVLAAIKGETQVDIQVLSGADEATLTFLAVRRWYGWSSGRLLVLDIGGGSLEIASGIDEAPDAAVSLPLGAGRLTRDWFTQDPPTPEEIRALRRHIRTEIGRRVGDVTRYGPPNHAVATSKTFKQLARMAGAAPSSEGSYVRRNLTHEAVSTWAARMGEMSTDRRAALPGVSAGRAGQLLAGALVADATMDLFQVPTLEICPWALREGVIFRRLDGLGGSDLAPE